MIQNGDLYYAREGLSTYLTDEYGIASVRRISSVTVFVIDSKPGNAAQQRHGFVTTPTLPLIEVLVSDGDICFIRALDVSKMVKL